MATKQEVNSFLQTTIQSVKQNPQAATALPNWFMNFVSKGPMPVLIGDKFTYYKKLVNTLLPSIGQNGENELLYQVLVDLVKSNPPIYGGGVGSHISYEMMTYNEDMIALIGKFIEGYNH